LQLSAAGLFDALMTLSLNARFDFGHWRSRGSNSSAIIDIETLRTKNLPHTKSLSLSSSVTLRKNVELSPQLETKDVSQNLHKICDRTLFRKTCAYRSLVFAPLVRE
jgi:hypothetical protein